MGVPGVLVTGANGFFGKEIVSHLRAAGVPLRATDIGSGSVEKGIDYQKADITKPDELGRAVQDAFLIIHAAGLAHIFSPERKLAEKYRRVNEIGTANVVAAAASAGVQQIILISSVSVYGPSTQGMCSEDTKIDPKGPYALSKANAEIRAKEIAQQTGISLTILRLATLYGEGDPGNVGRLMRALDKRTFCWIGDGHTKKSLLYKGDAARACLAVAARSAPGVSVYNVSGPACTMRDIVGGLSKAIGKRPLPMRIPAHLAQGAGWFLSGLPIKWFSGLHSTIEKWLSEDVYDTGLFERSYGFRTQVDLDEGLRREVQWYLRGKRKTGQ